MTKSSATPAKLTPLMKQYFEIKGLHQDKLLLFRMGDFYELFFDDAVRTSAILGITLTSRNKKSEDETPMCGFPHHQLGNYVNKLLHVGEKVAICDQVEDPEEAVGIVRRAVTRVLSPGMIFDPDNFESFSPLYLAALDGQHLSFLETTTGEAFYFELGTREASEVFSLLEILRPAEFLLPEGSPFLQAPNLKEKFKALNLTLTAVSESVLKDLHLIKACNLILNYAQNMQGERVIQTIREFELRNKTLGLKLLPVTLRHLEIFENYSGDKSNTLFSILNQCQTPPGARLLKTWMRFPLRDKKNIENRWDAVEAHMQDFMRLSQLRGELQHLGDIERRFGKLSSPSLNPRDLYLLGRSLRVGLDILKNFANQTPQKKLQDLTQRIENTMVEEASTKLKEGSFVKKGFSPELDQLIYISENGQHELLELERKERELTGISSLKINYNSVFGYYIEVTKTHIAKVPDRYIRKQTLVNAERFVNPELQALESQILSSKVKRVELELEIFEDLRSRLLEAVPLMSKLGHQIAEIDVLSNLAWVALQRRYVRPQISQDGTLEIQKCRHPVVEAQPNVSFVPNDLTMKPGESLLLTGPNMAGKSTLMRQVALASILAQMGSFVPAESARLPLFDAIFSRIGASDSLAQGLSTFMVEMTETAEVLREITDKSLVVLDEIGRGTSTYDGLSLAQAILEYLALQKNPITLFATHYHEIAELEGKLPGLKNGHMKIQDKNGLITFLYTLSTGAAGRSYGVEVAELAGLPKSVVERARGILEKRAEAKLPPSNGAGDSTQSLDLFSWSSQSAEQELVKKYREWAEQFKSIDVNSMTPIEALNKLHSIRYAVPFPES